MAATLMCIFLTIHPLQEQCSLLKSADLYFKELPVSHAECQIRELLHRQFMINRIMMSHND